jgi:hypothetical protein
MDKERYEKEKSIYKNYKVPDTDGKFHNYRLIHESELPKWIREPVIYNFIL